MSFYKKDKASEVRKYYGALHLPISTTLINIQIVRVLWTLSVLWEAAELQNLPAGRQVFVELLIYIQIVMVLCA